MNDPFIFRRKYSKKVDPSEKYTQDEIDQAYEEIRQESEYNEMAENEINELREECDWMEGE